MKWLAVGVGSTDLSTRVGMIPTVRFDGKGRAKRYLLGLLTLEIRAPAVVAWPRKQPVPASAGGVSANADAHQDIQRNSIR